jgi:putative tryptophan/tyrosine transport system substrate-binding protein
MNRRGFVVRALLVLSLRDAARAQATEKVYRLGILAAGANERSAPFIAAFERRLRELGWVEGKNLVVDFGAGESREQAEAIVARFVRSRVDVILIPGPELGLSVASGATRTIPIVIAALNYDPVQKGYVKSLAQPGRNITGIHYRNPEVGAKQIELVHSVLPSASQVGLLWTRYSVDQVPPVETAASRLSLQLDKVELSSKADIPAAFAKLKARRVDAAIALGDPVVYGNRERIADAALEHRLPLFGQLSLAEAGGLLGFGPDLIAALQRAAEYADRILRGAAPDTMPIEQTAKFALLVNLKTAKALGVTVPQSVLLRADEVIQ